MSTLQVVLPVSMEATVTHILGQHQDNATAQACSLMATAHMAECMAWEGVRGWLALYVSDQDNCAVNKSEVIELAKASDAYVRRQNIKEQEDRQRFRDQFLGNAGLKEAPKLILPT